MVKRYIVDAQGPDHAAIKNAFKLLLDECTKDPTLSRIALLVPTKEQFKHSDVSYILGDAASRVLLKGNPVTVTGNASMYLESHNTISKSRRYDGVLALWPSADTLKKVDDLYDNRLTIVVPWTPADVQDWIVTWNPTQLGGIQKPSIDIDPILDKALSYLHDSVNVSTGLSHSLDKRKAIALFWYLRKGGVEVNPDHVRTWAKRHNWPSRHADELAYVAERTNARRSIPAECKGYWGKDLVKRLQQEE